MNQKRYIKLFLEDAKNILEYIQEVRPQLYITQCFVFDFPNSKYYDVEFSLNILDVGILGQELLRRFGISSNNIVFKLIADQNNIDECRVIGEKIQELHNKFYGDLKEGLMKAMNCNSLVTYNSENENS